MFILQNIYLSGFKGFKHISDTLSYSLDISNQPDSSTILLYGENGRGKTTLLENLTPYPSMISRTDIKDSIVFPATKIITFLNKTSNSTLRLETYWNSPTETKGYIFIGENTSPTIETMKGNITEFIIQIEKIFGEFKKFKYSTFLQQGIYEIIKAKPTERIKIINHFISDMALYEDIKVQASTKCDILKNQISLFESKQDEYKTFENKYIQIQEFETSYNKDAHLENIELRKKYIDLKNDLLLNLTKRTTLMEQKNSIELQIATFNIQSFTEEQTQYAAQICKINDELLLYKDSDTDFSKNISLLTSSNQSINTILSAINETSQLPISFPTPLNQNTLNKLLVECKNEIDTLRLQTKEQERLLFINQSLSSLLTKRNHYLDLFSNITPESPALFMDKTSIQDFLLSENNKKSFLSSQLLTFISHQSRILQNEKMISEILTKFNTSSIADIEKSNIKQSNLLHEINLKITELSKLKNTQKNILFTENLAICSCCGQTLNTKQIAEHIETIETFLVENDLATVTDNILALTTASNKIKIADSENSSLRLSISTHNENTLLTEIDNSTQHISFLTNQYKKIERIEQQGIKQKNLLTIIADIDLEIASLSQQSKEIIKSSPATRNTSTNEILQSRLITISSLLAEVAFLETIQDDKINNWTSLKDSLTVLQEANCLKLDTINNRHILSQTLKQKLIILNSKMNDISILFSKYETNKRNIEDITKQISEIPTGTHTDNFYSEQISILDKQIETTTVSLHEYSANKSWLEKTVQIYKVEKAKYDEDCQLLFSYNKIKNYTDRIRRTFISEFFGNLTSDINTLLSNDKGTLGHLKIRIEHKTINKFDILVNDGFEDVSDISLLSGAEQATVARAIYFALAKMTNFGILWLDEFDGMLSPANKEVFVETLFKIKDFVGVEQIFIISHNPNLIKEVDYGIEIK